MNDAVNVAIGTALMVAGIAFAYMTVMLLYGLVWVLVPILAFVLFVEYALFCACRTDFRDAVAVWKDRRG